jgi:hypothetical protein
MALSRSVTHLHCACAHWACDSRYRIIYFVLCSLADPRRKDGSNKPITFPDAWLIQLYSAVCVTKELCTAIRNYNLRWVHTCKNAYRNAVTLQVNWNDMELQVKISSRASRPKGEYTLVTLPRIVTSYRESVDGTRDRVTYQKSVTR